jgi:hypothetical protein
MRILIPNHQLVVVVHIPSQGGLVTLVNLCTKISGCVGSQMRLNLMDSRIRRSRVCNAITLQGCLIVLIDYIGSSAKLL